MKRFYSFLVTAIVSLSYSLSVMAIDPPTGAELVDGQAYLFQNIHKRSSWLGHTSWDGALYYNNASAEKFVYFKAVSNEDGSWSFTEVFADYPDSVSYMVIPNGTDNLNSKPIASCVDPETAPRYIFNKVSDGVYSFIVGEGNNYNTIGRPVHMNAGNEYVVASEPVNGGGWYPDFYGGGQKDEYDQYIYEPEESNFIVMADSSTCLWNLVKYEDRDAYMGKASAYVTINNFETSYVNNEELADYNAGFQATLDLIAGIYNSAEYDYSIDNATISEAVNAKVNLYKKIAAAIEENDDENAALALAITSATNVFNTSTDPVSLQSATTTLGTAIQAHQEGSGDLTSMIQNNSFEDLSSQDGQQTASVAGAPTGWNVYVNGNQVTTAAEVKSAGFTAWHGINNDADGELDGSLAFGIWNSGIPTYELSQKIEGLENGTYVVTASLMAGANGNGSRMTTQRIFANLNSTYFGYETDYDKDQLDQSESFGFQGNDQTYTTDRTLFPMEVVTYVYDGTLTIGVRTDGNYKATLRTSANGAGGDGWFKVDNFHLQKVGYTPEAALELLNHFVAVLEDYSAAEYKSAAMRDKLETKIADFKALNASSPADDVNAAITEAVALVSEAAADVKAYDELNLAIIAAYENLETYQDKPGAGDYGDVIMEVEENFNDGVYSVEECAQAIKNLDTALQECIQSDVFEAGDEITSWLKNPGFENLSAQDGNNSNGVEATPYGWHLMLEGNESSTKAENSSYGMGWCAINSGDNIDITDPDGNQWFVQYTEGEHLWGIWANPVPAVELYQELNLPAGVYTLSADIIVQNDWAGFNLGGQRLFAGDYVTMFGDESRYSVYLPEDAKAAQEHQNWHPDAEYPYLSYAGNYQDINYDISGLPYKTTVTFCTDGTDKTRLGFRTDRTDLTTGELSTQASMGWFKLDNFQLFCVSKELPTAIQTASNVNVNANVTYNLAGQVVNDTFKGVVIKNGKKQIVK